MEEYMGQQRIKQELQGIQNIENKIKQMKQQIQLLQKQQIRWDKRVQMNYESSLRRVGNKINIYESHEGINQIRDNKKRNKFELQNKVREIRNQGLKELREAKENMLKQKKQEIVYMRQISQRNKNLVQNIKASQLTRKKNIINSLKQHRRNYRYTVQNTKKQQKQEKLKQLHRLAIQRIGKKKNLQHQFKQMQQKSQILNGKIKDKQKLVELIQNANQELQLVTENEMKTILDSLEWKQFVEAHKANKQQELSQSRIIHPNDTRIVRMFKAYIDRLITIQSSPLKKTSRTE